nr:MAG TPA: Nfn subunit A, Nfn subunit [Caudoviricetes sp.]
MRFRPIAKSKSYLSKDNNLLTNEKLQECFQCPVRECKINCVRL